MYIKKVEGWTDVGYVERDFYVPYNSEIPEQYKPAWSATDIHPSADRLFSSFVLPKDKDSGRTPENFRHTKYIRVEFDMFDYPIFGWVDDVRYISTRHTGVNWHIDHWRTYVRKCQYRGWKKLRHPDTTGMKNDPYHEIPAFNQRATLEDIPIGYQARGIAWVIITYIEGDSTVWQAVKAAGGAVLPKVWDGLKEFVGATIAIFAPGPANAAQASIDGMVPNAQSRDPVAAGVQNNYFFFRDNDCVRTLVVPISLNADQSIYFTTDSIEAVQGMFQPNTSKLHGPTLFDVVNGNFARQLGIKAGQLINCVVSPVAPFRTSAKRNQTGLRESEAIWIRNTNDDILIPHFSGESYMILLSAQKGNRGYVKIKGFGIKDVGPINEGCPQLDEVLDKYYLGYYDIVPYVNDKGYKVVVEKSTWHTEDNRMLVPFTTYMDLVYPLWRTYGSIDISQCWKYDEVKKKNVSCFYVSKQPLKYGYWHRKFSRENQTITYYSVDAGGFKDICDMLDEEVVISKNIKFLDIQYSYIRVMVKRVVGDNTLEAFSVSYNDLFIAITPPQEQPKWPDRIEFKEDIKIHTFSYAAKARMGWFNSLGDWRFVGGIYSRSLMFGKVRCELPRTYQTDDYNDMLIIGPNGDILHKFKRGIRIKGYTYQLVIDQTPYLKLKFDLESGQSRYAMAADAEVHVPLTPMTASTSYSNPWSYVSETTQRYFRNQFENEQQARAKNLEWDNILLERKRETSGIKQNVGIVMAKTMSQMYDLVRPLVTGFGKGIKAIGKTAGLGDMLRPLAGFKALITPHSELRKQKPSDNFFTTLGEGLERIGNVEIPVPDVTSFYEDETKLFERKWGQEAAERDFRHRIGGFNLPPTETSVLCVADTSWLSEYGSLRLVHLTKDDYSINRYFETSGVLGIEVNEHVPDFTDIEPGPLKVEPCIISGKDVPIEAIEDIRNKLEGGVYIDKNL